MSLKDATKLSSHTCKNSSKYSSPPQDQLRPQNYPAVLLIIYTVALAPECSLIDARDRRYSNRESNLAPLYRLLPRRTCGWNGDILVYWSMCCCAYEWTRSAGVMGSDGMVLVPSVVWDPLDDSRGIAGLVCIKLV